ncbi:Transcriptional activator protein CzcR [Methylocella tundrae]|uniref:Transcriptional activator protein CzcR n=1 Tax=Methylocella tundrae TaxID=227605 RepID=A0A8B6M5N0_METTU|nr:response regulator transcription factor [Methylocella tundrae]VTZ27462.1 Transcriptional activator protein CzcR [Methylocella tundrae]VTZ50145.1 Transcriptional activator protein CzcR [Methylocella tundrae]
MSEGNVDEQRPLLLVEDEPALAQEIGKELERLGYMVKVATSEAAGLEAARSTDAALLIVDRMLANTDSLSMIETLRGEGNRTPVLFVSGLATVDERIRGLKAGGDDYLTKPFAMGELAARVEALLRRSNDAPTVMLRVGPLELDLIARSARRGERTLDLLPTEFKLLEYLMRRPGQVVTRAMLLEDVWHYRFLPQTNLVDVHIGKLRRKMDMGGEPTLIRSVRRSGFRLDVDADR